MSPVNQGMGGGALKGTLSGVGCAAQTLPFKTFKSVHFAAPFRDLLFWEHLLCFFMIFGFNEVFLQFTDRTTHVDPAPPSDDGTYLSYWF